MAIVSLDEAKRQLSIDTDDTSVDMLLQSYVDSITGAVEEHKNEVVEQREVTDELVLDNADRFRLWNRPVISLTSVETVDGDTTWDVSNMHASPSGLVRVRSGDSVDGIVTVIYDAGYEDVPDRYKRGALVILQHLWETQRGEGEIPGGVIGQEEQTYDPRSFYDIPRKALEWLGPPRPMVA